MPYLIYVVFCHFLVAIQCIEDRVAKVAIHPHILPERFAIVQWQNRRVNPRCPKTEDKIHMYNFVIGLQRSTTKCDQMIGIHRLTQACPTNPSRSRNRAILNCTILSIASQLVSINRKVGLDSEITVATFISALASLFLFL